MDFIQMVLLGAIAGFTIFIGLPIGRMKAVSDKLIRDSHPAGWRS